MFLDLGFKHEKSEFMSHKLQDVFVKMFPQKPVLKRRFLAKKIQVTLEWHVFA